METQINRILTVENNQKFKTDNAITDAQMYQLYTRHRFKSFTYIN